MRPSAGPHRLTHLHCAAHLPPALQRRAHPDSSGSGVRQGAGRISESVDGPRLYVVGIIAASWHFSYGVWLFAAKWGITIGETALRRFGYVCFAMALGLVAIGMVGMSGFFRTPYRPWDPNSSTDNIVMR